ncbi:MAG TPA: MFS transporter [Burkholderiales bacterium]|nr:MFS transporter [Burkholderiales bacterium]
MTNWRSIWAVFCGGLVAGAYITKVPPTLPALRVELGLSLVESTFIVTTFNVLGMLVGMIAGMLGDRFGRKRLSIAGLVLMAIGGAMGATVNEFVPLLFSRFIEGVGFILFVVPAPALMSAMAANASDRAKALGLWGAYMPSGGTIALLLAPILIAASGWRSLWVLLAVAAVLAAIVIALAVSDPPRAKVSSFRLVTESLTQPGNIALAILFAFYVAQWTSIMVWLPTFLIEHGASTAGASVATALMVLVNVPGNLLGGWLLSRKVPRARLIIIAAAISALCEIGMLPSVLPGEVRFLLVLVFSFFSAFMPSSIFGGLPVHARSPAHIATGTGMVQQTSNLGQFFGPLAIAMIASRFGGWEAAVWVMLAFAAGAALCGVAIGAIERRLAGSKIPA